MANALGSGTRFGSEVKGSGGYEATRSYEFGRHAQYANSTYSLWYGMDLSHGMGLIDYRNGTGSRFGQALAMVKQTCQESTPAANVPDGGSTAIMMGAAVLGLAFMQKRLRA